MMKKIIFAAAIMLCTAFSNAYDMDIVLCKEKNYDCQVIQLTDVKKVERVADGTILRVTFTYGHMLDIRIAGMVVDIKKKK